MSGRCRGRCCKHGRYKPSCHMRRHGQTRHVFFSFLHSRYPVRTQPRSQQPKKKAQVAHCSIPAPFHSLMQKMMRIECSRNKNKNKRKKKKNEKRRRQRQKMFNVSAAEASTRAGTTNEKESERKKWQQRHKARQSLGCCEQISKRKNTAY